MNVFFINDSTSNPNWGDRAAAISLKRMIKQMGGIILAALSEDELEKSKFTLDSCYTESNEYQSTFKRRIKLIIPPILYKAKQLLENRLKLTSNNIIPNRIDDYDNFIKKAVEHKLFSDKFLETLNRSDVTVIHGNGAIVGDDQVGKAELFLSYFIKKVYKKPVLLINHTADLRNPELYKIAQLVYPLLDDVVFRDQISVERTRSICKGRYAADTAFLFNPMSSKAWLSVVDRATYFDVWPDSANFKPAEPYICIGGSSLFYYHPGSNHYESYSKLIEHLHNTYPGNLVLTVSDFRDQAIFRRLAQAYALPVIGLTTPVQQAVDILGNAQAYIGGRWHPSIFALRGGTPVIALTSKTFKMKALTEMAGLSSKAYDALDFKNEIGAIGKQLNDYLEEQPFIREKIRSWAERQSENCWDNLRFLKGLRGKNLNQKGAIG